MRPRATLLAVLLALGPALALAGCGAEAPAPAPAAPPSAGKAPAAAPARGAYPLDTCVVSDEKLGSMGDPVVVVHEGTEVRFCCAKCVETFRKDPAKYVGKVKAAAPK